jgi:hypothetical protein
MDVASIIAPPRLRAKLHPRNALNTPYATMKAELEYWLKSYWLILKSADLLCAESCFG